MTRRVLAIGLGIIAIANGFVLAGVAYNRIGEPESHLPLTERELRVESRGERSENSGVTVRVEWCVVDSIEAVREIDEVGFELQGCFGRAPTWLNADRLRDLGFDMTLPATDPEAASHYNRMLSRQAYFVLELGSPWYERVVERSRAFVARREQALAFAPDSTLLRREVISLRQRFAWLERSSTRLFLIDAGRSVADLRAKYPDRSRYAIVRGTVKPTIRTSITAGRTVRIVGQIGDISSTRINVPARYQQLLRGVVRSYDFPYTAPPPSQTATVWVAFGKRLEPWITSAK